LKCEETSWSSMPPYSLLWDAFQNVDYTWFAIFVYSLKFVVMASSSKDQLLNFVHLIKKKLPNIWLKTFLLLQKHMKLSILCSVVQLPKFLEIFLNLRNVSCFSYFILCSSSILKWCNHFKVVLHPLTCSLIWIRKYTVSLSSKKFIVPQRVYMITNLVFSCD
jgi:hypothetical protein